MKNIKDKKISIVIPVYNKESEIENTLLTIKNQTIDNYEIVIVNDGSKDNSLEIIKSYFEKNKNIEHKIIDKYNEGVSIARNTGISESKGDYIFFMDGDDKIENDCLEILLRNIEKENIDFSLCGYNVLQNNIIVNTNKDLKSARYSNTEILKLFILSKLNIYMGNALYKTEIIKNNCLKFDSSYKYNEDQVFIYKYLMNCKEVFFEENKLFTYYRGETSVTMKARPERLTDVRIFINFKEELKEDFEKNKEIIVFLEKYKIPYSILIGCTNLVELGYDKNEFIKLLNENNEILKELKNFNIKYGKKALLKILLLRMNKTIFYNYIKS